MYSQRDEEKYILEFFGKALGKFLDIGAYDGKTFSNIYQLALQKWSGVCVEPSPSVLPSLRSLYENNKNIWIVDKGVGLKRGEVLFYDFKGDAVSSFVKKHAETWRLGEGDKRNYRQIKIEVITVADLFKLVGTDFNFISIDAEGWSLRILENLPFKSLTDLTMICVEFDGEEQEVKSILKPYGFKQYHKTAENLILVR